MKRFLFGLVILSLLLTACGSQQQQTQKGGAFIGGTSGLIASFEPISPKEGNLYTIFDTEDFSLDIKLKNKGEENVPIGKATVHVLGPQPELFQNIPAWQLVNKGQVEKISEFNPDGGEEVIPFASSNGAKYIGSVTGFTDITWNAEYWYDYKTYLIINDVCFKGDLTDPKVCEVKQAKTYSVSGAPITVTAVDEDSAGRGVVVLKITVRNAGTGKATAQGEDFDTRFDKVTYMIDEPAKWECKSGGRENEARLVDGTAQIICRLKVPLADQDLFTKQLRLTFGYVYKDLVQEKLRIKESVR